MAGGLKKQAYWFGISHSALALFASVQLLDMTSMLNSLWYTMVA